MFTKHTIVLFLLMAAQGLNADSCQTPEGYNGDCQPITKCPSLVKLHDNGPISPGAARYLELAKCGFEGDTSKVCCPPPRSNLLPDTPTCGEIPYSKISLFGERAELDEFPWMALLGYQKAGGSRQFLCSGALINNRYVMTTANCIKPTLVSVRLGEYNLETDPDCITFGTLKDCAPPVVDVPVEEAIVHEKYNSSDKNLHHDIALLRLKQEVNFTDFIKPVCLPTTPEAIAESIVGNKLFIASWSRSKLKHKVQIPVRALTDCSDVYTKNNIANLTLMDGQLCAGGEEGKDSCRGDGGGPLMMIKKDQNKDSYWYALGVVSFGPSPCGVKDWPSVYTKVAKYVGWISSKLKP